MTRYETPADRLPAGPGVAAGQRGRGARRTHRVGPGQPGVVVAVAAMVLPRRRVG